MKQYEMFELTFKGDRPADEINVDLSAKFTIGNKQTAVKGFYAGNGTYKIRFYPSDTGIYRWETNGIFTEKGEEVCKKSDSHGIVKAQGTHFEYADDGSVYHPFGTTVYAILYQTDELYEQTMESLKNSPFNKIRFCVFPKHYDYNHSEPTLMPYEFTDGKPDIKKPVYEFWDKLENTIVRMGEMGIQVDLIVFHPYDRWGFSRMSKESCFEYIEYLTRRLSAYPNIWWSLANEYDILVRYAGWFPEFSQHIAERDCYKHLLSNHHVISPWDFSDPNTTHVCLQTANVDSTLKWMQRYNKPVVYDEVQYEGNIPMAWGCLTGEDMTERFWKCCTVGGYCTHGETIVDQTNDKNSVLWWACGGKLKGESVPRIAFLRSIIEELPPLKPLDGQFYVPFFGMTLPDLIALERDGKVPLFAQAFRRTLTEEGMKQLDSIPLRCIGHSGEDAYLYYLGRFRPVEFTLVLPDKGEYEITIIDTWNMKREVVKSGVNGDVTVSLPSKPYMAIMAIKK